MTESTARSGPRRWATGAALVAAGLLGGAALAGTLSASAETPSTGASTGASTGTDEATPGATAPRGSRPAGPDGTVDESQPQRSDEQLLTGDTRDSVEAAVLARYPGATVLRLETDSDGVYEAHLTTADGQRVTVEVDASFAVTGEESGGPGRHRGDRAGTDEDDTDATAAQDSAYRA